MNLIFQYIKDMIPYCLIGAVIYVIIMVKYHRGNNTKIELGRELIILLFITYCAGLVSQTIIPRWDIGIDSGNGKPYFDVYWNNELASINIIPFKTIFVQFAGNNNVVGQSDVHSVSLLNLLANLFLFSPLGLFLPMLWHKLRNIKYIVGVGVIISTCIEVIQLFVGRSSDIDDVILNTLGVVIGFIFYKFLATLRRKQ